MGKAADKVLLFLFSAAVLILSGIGLIAALEWLARGYFVSFVDAMYMPGAVKYASIAVCAALFLLSIRFLYVSLRRSRDRGGTIDQRTDYGDIRISLETIENLALRAAGRLGGVKDLRSRVRVDDSGLDIQLRSVVDGETSIQLLTEEMQRGVKEYVEEITGIPVAMVTVYVANVVQTQTYKPRVE
mgnify:CR=1 FL=1